MTERPPFHFSLSRIGKGNGNPLQCSCLENPRDGGTWWAAVCGVAPSRTRLKRLSSSSSMLLLQFFNFSFNLFFKPSLFLLSRPQRTESNWWRQSAPFRPQWRGHKNLHRTSLCVGKPRRTPQKLKVRRKKYEIPYHLSRKTKAK